jgi:hypothetical protein
MIDRLLKIHLEPIARAHRRWRLLRTLTFGWLAAAAVGLIFVLADHSAGKISSWPFLLLFVAALAWTLVVWWRNRRSELDYNLIVRNIEQENPQLHAILLTAVEQQPDPATGQLNYLQTRVIQEALAQDQQSNWRRREVKRLRLARLSSAGSFVALAIVLGSLYHAAPPRMANLVHEKRNEVSVTPGDTSIEKGTSLVVLAKFGDNPPSDATLIVRPANAQEQRIALTKNLNDPVFGTSLPEVKNDLTYRVEYNGGSTRDFRVSVFEFPRLERADAKIKFPEYTSLPEKAIENTRRISAVEGSAVDYTFNFNKPVKSAVLRSRATKTNAPVDSGYALVADTNRPNIYKSNFKLEKSGSYELVLVDDAGRTNRLPPQFVFVALTNRTPDLKFISPRGDQRVSALEEIAFKAEVSDDFGLKAYGLAYNLAGQETKIIEIGKSSTANEKRPFNYLVKLEDLGAQPDQLVSYYLWADDVGPDGNVRRTTSDMFFAEVRPFEEIFREGQAQDPNQQQQRQQGQQGGQNQSERLAELQKQIITATWNLQRRETGKSPTPKFKEDAGMVKDSQQEALDQVQQRRENAEDPKSIATLDSVEKEMKKAAEHLADASDKNTVQPLPSALSSEQAAYQSLLRLAAREYQVAQGQRGQQGQNSRGARAQRQIDQLNLRQTQNRYETERQAAPQQNQQQREQLQAFNRLKELAQRQQDVNERLRELQAALQEAKTDAEREEMRERLKRLQEEQQQMLADIDELRQRMDRPENQSQMSESRQQLDQTRDEAQRASDAMNRGEMQQALSSGARAQEDLQRLRDDFRRQTSSQFADDMRQMRSQARELAQKQDDIGQKLDELNNPNQQKTLTDSDERKELASQLDEQKKRIEDLTKHATDVTEKAEAVEPLLAKQLYDTLRQASQNDTKDVQDAADDLVTQGRLSQNSYNQLRRTEDKSVEVAANLLRQGFPQEANNFEQRARRSINEFKDGIERAAGSVLGDDTEALRLARAELDELARQLDRELAQARGGTNTNGVAGARASQNTQQRNGGQRGENQTSEQNQSELANAQAGNGRQQTENQNARDGENGQQQENQQGQQGQGQSGQQVASANQNGRDAQGGNQNEQQNGEGGQQRGGNQRAQNGQGNQQQGNSQQGQDGQQGQQVASANQNQNGGRNGQRGQNQGGQRGGARNNGGERAGGGGNFVDQLGGANGGEYWGGPITGTDYTQWSDRLRDVEEMLDVPELRAEVARIRDRARTIRSDFKRGDAQPKWDLVKVQVAGPLIELRERVNEELARRESKDALVPIDRDPVPTRYSELVRRYYEQLGKSESDPAKPK